MTFDPCKFCGSEAVEVRRPSFWRPWLNLKFYCGNCLSCGAQGPFVGCDSEEDATDAWNRTGWVSVEERLPDDRRRVLVEGGVAYYDSDKERWHTLMESHWPTIEWAVTRWMPPPWEQRREGGRDD